MRLLLLGLLLTAQAALASPATDLFDRAAGLVQEHYHGFSSVNPAAQAQAVRADLTRACADAPDTCPITNGEAALNRYLSAFGDGHLYALSPDRYALTRARYTASVPPQATFGLVLGPSGRGGTLVTDVVAGSPADRAGLHPGDRLQTPDGQALQAAGLDNQATLDVQVARGPVSAPSERRVTLTRATLAPLLLPELFAPADAPAGVLVLRVPNFQYAQQVGPRVHALVREAQARGARGLILDLRGGRGGSNYECEMAAGAFIGPFRYEVETRRGTFPAGWTGTRSLDASDRAYIGVGAQWTSESLAYDLPDPARWTGPTAVLLDGDTASCHEYAAYFLQQAGRAKVIGAPTRGLLNTGDLVVDLPDGGGLFLPAFRSFTQDGQVFPQRVTPDVTVTPNPQGFADTGDDPMLDAAYSALGLK